MRTDLALAALASAAVPGMKPVAVAAVSPGDDELAAELQSAVVEDATGRRWLVRCPLSPVAGARLQRNDELVRHLSRHLPFKVPAAVGQAPVGKDGHAVVYPHVEGSPLELRRLPAGPGLASAVGRALAAVHNIPRAVFEEQDVPVFDASGARQRAVAEVDRAAETGRVPSGLLARWEEAFEAAPLWQFATTPVHGAFTGSRVVVAFTDAEDAASGRVVAVTDWDEAMVGDPALDLAELYVQTSRQAWDAVLDSYALARAHRPDPYLQARARLVAELRHLRGLARAVAEGDEEGARRVGETLRRVDRLTEADDSLVPVTARPSGAGTRHETEAPQAGVGVAAAGSADDARSAAAPDEGDDATTEVPLPPSAPDDDGEALVEADGAWDDDRTREDDDAPGNGDRTMQIPVGELGAAVPDDHLDPAPDHEPETDEPGDDAAAFDDAVDVGATDGPTPDPGRAAGNGLEDDATGDDPSWSDGGSLTGGVDPVDARAATDGEHDGEAGDGEHDRGVTDGEHDRGAADGEHDRGAGDGEHDRGVTDGDGGAADGDGGAAELGRDTEDDDHDRRGIQDSRDGVPLEDLRDDERLQELYGMPAPDRSDRN